MGLEKKLLKTKIVFFEQFYLSLSRDNSIKLVKHSNFNKMVLLSS